MNVQIPGKILSLLLACLLGFGGLPVFTETSAMTDKTVTASAPDATAGTAQINQEANSPSVSAENAQPDLGLDCKSAVLMEASTGKILYAKQPDDALPPASVTKIMTLLLIMEAIDSGRLKLTDTVTASTNASSMGGSQIFLKEGEQMSVEDLLKSVVIASANDAAVALAEHISGSVEAFVGLMNIRAKELGMEHSSFENVTGLDDAVTKHLTSAEDIAIMSRELIRHETILKYSSIWMDTIRDGAFGLTNTNRLVRFYNGCTGLKTGSTSKAGFCISVTATRGGMTLISVIMGSPNRDARNQAAAKLLDWGFANYGVFRVDSAELAPMRVLGGIRDNCRIGHGSFSCVLKKEQTENVVTATELPETLSATVKEGDVVGQIRYSVGGTEIGKVPIKALEDVPKIGFWGVFSRMLAKFMLI